MSVNIGKATGTIIILIVFLSIMSGLYPSFVDLIDNITGSGFVGTLILTVLKTIYWIIVGAVTVLGFISGMGLNKLMKEFDRMI